MSTQQQAQAGDNARIIQIFGDNNIVGDRPHLTIHCPQPERRLITVPAQDEAALLRPGVEATEFAGRSDILDDFTRWAKTHDPKRLVSVRVVHGGAGVGKTRFALELCRALGPDWQAGFVPGKEARRFLGQTNLANWGWQKSTLVVFDYALSLVDVLPDWTRELCAVTQRPHPLRILLLERQAEEQSGWLEQAFPGGFGFDATGPRDLLDGPPTLLPGLSSPLVQRGIMQNMLDRLGSRVVLPPDDPSFQARLAATDWAGAPLYLMMAAMVMHQQGGVGEVLHLGRVDLAQFVATHEYERLRRPCNGKRSLEILLPHMAALATLCSGIEADALSQRLQREKEILGCNDADMATARELLAQLMPDGNEGVAPILPDIVGEAFVLERLAGGRQIEGRQAVLRAFGDRPSEVAAVLVRCVQDFVPRRGRGATRQLEKAQQRALAWLRELGEMPELPLERLLILVGALPTDTEALRSLAADWQERAVVQLRKKTDKSIDYKRLLAMNLNNLAKRLSDMGQRQEALKIALEVVAIRRELVVANPDTFRSELALSLNNLANSLSNAGQRQEALKIAFESVALYRQLADTKLNTFRPDLARSLNNLANRLGKVGQCQQALTIAQESVVLYRQLADATPDSFRPDLATSLNNLANRLSNVGQWQKALNIALESVAIYRQLADANPDAFRPALASSLNNLAQNYSVAGQHQEAFKIAHEAISICHQLFDTNPDAFKPVLASSLNNLANRLSDAGQRQKALEIAQDAVVLYRQLAEANQDAFQPDLAGSLNNLANRLSNAGQRQEALGIAQEATALYRQLADANQNAFRPDLAMSLHNLANSLSDAGQSQEALKIAGEATALYKKLTHVNPDYFRPHMAASLITLAQSLSNAGQRQEALPIARESARRYFDLAWQLPEAFGQNAAIAITTWLSLRNNISQDDAIAMFQQDPQTQIDALFDDSDEPSPSDTSTPPEGAA